MATESTQELSIKQASEALQGFGTLIMTAVSSVPAGLSTWHPDEGEWCMHECLGHIIEAERRGFNGRIRLILQENSPRLPGWDQRAIAAERDDCHRPTDILVQEFRSLRADSVQLLESLTSPDLDRSGVHPLVGRLSVRELLHEWLFHDANHARQMLKNLEDGVWSHMGNAQKFSPPPAS